MSIGNLGGPTGFSLSTCLYVSAETCTSLGFGDITPHGPVRLLAGVEGLNGLLLIRWSASFTCICMERFWGPTPAVRSESGDARG
ncbi:MAG: ion channel [Rubrivivax sp.]